MEEVLTAPARTSIMPARSQRIESIDLLRGVIMIIMALDHVRDYFHAQAFTGDALNLATTTPFLYFTRWVTHFCAPLFMFLSGTSAFLVGVRKGRRYLSKFLFTRGLWLVCVEVTIVSFAWSFNPHLPSTLLGVIWALGISMIVLSILIYLPLKWIIAFGVLMVFGHNLLDNIHVAGNSAGAFLWALLHEQQIFRYPAHEFFVGYPIIPWIGVMALGYCLGSIYKREIDRLRRKKILLALGTLAIILFVLLRYINLYGDPSRWSSQNTVLFTFLSFMKVSKYPPSLFYLLITVGPGILFLAFSEKWKSWLTERIKIIGRVPMFYYVVHLYLIHLAALIATNFCGHKSSDMILNTWVSFEPKLTGYGFSLGTVYAVWGCLIITLYFLCKWYDRYKSSHKEKWWLSYL